MDVLHNYSEFLSMFMSLIVGGMGVKLALQKNNHQSYQIGDKNFAKQKVHTGGILLLLGVVIQVVADSMETLDGRQLLLDEKILSAYAFVLLVMVFKKH